MINMQKKLETNADMNFLKLASNARGHMKNTSKKRKKKWKKRMYQKQGVMRLCCM